MIEHFELYQSIQTLATSAQFVTSHVNIFNLDFMCIKWKKKTLVKCFVMKKSEVCGVHFFHPIESTDSDQKTEMLAFLKSFN